MKIMAQQQQQSPQSNNLPSAAGLFQQFSGFNRVNPQKSSSYPESGNKPSSKTNQKSQVSSANTDNNNYQNAAMPDFLQSMMSNMMNNFGQQQQYRRDARKEIANDEE